MRKRLWLNLLIALIAAIYLQELTGVNALSPVGSPTNAASIMPFNTLEACNAHDSSELDKYGKAKIATGPFSWCFLRAIAAVAPARSWTEKQIDSGVDLTTAFENYFNADADVPDILKYMTWGLTSVAAGVVWLLLLIFFIAPLLWCVCCRKCCIRDADLRGRTGRICNQVTFWICWVLAFLFVFGSIYWSSWMRPDFHAAFCLPMKTGEDIYLNGLVKDGSTFAALAQAPDFVQQFQDVAATVTSSIDFSTSGPKAIVKMWQPATVFSPYIWDDLATGATPPREFTAVNLTMTREKFGVQLYDNRVTASIPEGTLDRVLFDTNDALYAYQVFKWPTSTIDSAIAGFVQSTVTPAIKGVNDTINDLQTQFIDIYDTMTDFLDDVLREKSSYDTWPFALLITISCLPVIGLVAALVLFLYYKRQDEFSTQSNSKWRMFTGFMIFGYAFWGIILFLYGGALLGPMYWPSDVCRAIDKTLDSSDVTRYDTMLGTDLQGTPNGTTILNSCIKRDPDTSLWTELDDSVRWEQIDTEISAIQAQVSSAIKLSDVSSNLNNIPTPNPYVIPILPAQTAPSMNLTWFCTGLDYEEADANLDSTVVTALQTDYGVCPTLQTSNRFGTIKQLTDDIRALSIQTTDACQFCIYPYCSEARIEAAINIEYLKEFPTPTNYSTLLGSTTGWPDKITAIDGFFGLDVDATPEVLSLKNKLKNDCAPDVNTALATSMEWWYKFYVLIQRGAALYDGWKSQGDDFDLSWNTNQPLFSRLWNRQNPLEGSYQVSYQEWKESFADDMAAIVASHADPAQSEEFASAIVKETNLGSIRTQYDTAISSYDCRAVSLTIEEIKDSVCDSFFGDVAAVSTLAVWLAVLHLIAFIVLMIFWTARRRYRDKQKVKEVSEAEDSTPSTTTASPTPVVREGLTEAQFFYACEHGDVETARKAADQYPPNSVVEQTYHNTPLHLAAYYGRIEITQDLCQRGWDPNAFNYKRHTPFTACVSNLYLDTDIKIKVMTILKDYGAWVDVYTGEGDTPLMIATRANERQIVALLLDWDANPLKRDGDYHWSTLQLAQSANNHEVLEMLREASPRHQNSPTHY